MLVNFFESLPHLTATPLPKTTRRPRTKTQEERKKLYQHRPQITSQFVCVINAEKSAADNGVTLWSIFSRNGFSQWHAAMASSHGTPRWHPAMAPQQWHPSNGTQQWHPAMASSNGTHCMAPLQWHPAMAPNVNPAKVGSQPPPIQNGRE